MQLAQVLDDEPEEKTVQEEADGVQDQFDGHEHKGEELRQGKWSRRDIWEEGRRIHRKAARTS